MTTLVERVERLEHKQPDAGGVTRHSIRETEAGRTVSIVLTAEGTWPEQRLQVGPCGEVELPEGVDDVAFVQTMRTGMWDQI